MTGPINYVHATTSGNRVVIACTTSPDGADDLNGSYDVFVYLRPGTGAGPQVIRLSGVQGDPTGGGGAEIYPQICRMGAGWRSHRMCRASSPATRTGRTTYS